MPKLDGTGPNGKGPMTGRGSGYCVIPLNTTEQGLEFLRNQEQVLKQKLKHIGARIKSLKSRGIETVVTDVEDIEETVKLYLQGKLPNLTERLH